MRKLKRFSFIPIILLLFTVVLSGSCDATNTGENQETPTAATSPVSSTIKSGTTQIINNISAAEAKELIQANTANPNFIIIDVRTPEEYAQGHLENAILIDYNNDSFKTEIKKLNRNKKYLIYCRTGNRSAGARDFMQASGFMDINHMDGGITEWQSRGYPVVK
jgi:phage shock protein E